MLSTSNGSTTAVERSGCAHLRLNRRLRPLRAASARRKRGARRRALTARAGHARHSRETSALSRGVLRLGSIGETSGEGSGQAAGREAEVGGGA
eukprot:5573282-Pleurochrysis_carterae.AAC.9